MVDLERLKFVKEDLKDTDFQISEDVFNFVMGFIEKHPKYMKWEYLQLFPGHKGMGGILFEYRDKKRILACIEINPNGVMYFILKYINPKKLIKHKGDSFMFLNEGDTLKWFEEIENLQNLI